MLKDFRCGEGLGRLSFWRLRPVGMRVLSGWRSSALEEETNEVQEMINSL